MNRYLVIFSHSSVHGIVNVGVYEADSEKDAIKSASDDWKYVVSRDYKAYLINELVDGWSYYY